MRGRKRKAQKPQIQRLKGPKSNKVNEGSSLTLRCKAKAKPNPVFTWYRNGVLIKSGRGQRIKNSKRSSRLKIPKASAAANEGVYTCTATNAVGAASKNTTVKVTPSASMHKPCEKQTLCFNGGTCRILTDMDQTYCQCPQQWAGNRCEILDISIGMRNAEVSREATLMYERTLIIVGIVIALLVFVVICIASYFLANNRRKRWEAKRRMKQQRRPENDPLLDKMDGAMPLHLSPCYRPIAQKETQTDNDFYPSTYNNPSGAPGSGKPREAGDSDHHQQPNFISNHPINTTTNNRMSFQDAFPHTTTAAAAVGSTPNHHSNHSSRQARPASDREPHDLLERRGSRSRLKAVSVDDGCKDRPRSWKMNGGGGGEVPDSKSMPAIADSLERGGGGGGGGGDGGGEPVEVVEMETLRGCNNNVYNNNNNINNNNSGPPPPPALPPRHSNSSPRLSQGSGLGLGLSQDEPDAPDMLSSYVSSPELMAVPVLQLENQPRDNMRAQLKTQPHVNDEEGGGGGRGGGGWGCDGGGDLPPSPPSPPLPSQPQIQPQPAVLPPPYNNSSSARPGGVGMEGLKKPSAAQPVTINGVQGAWDSDNDDDEGVATSPLTPLHISEEDLNGNVAKPGSFDQDFLPPPPPPPPAASAAAVGEDPPSPSTGLSPLPLDLSSLLDGMYVPVEGLSPGSGSEDDESRGFLPRTLSSTEASSPVMEEDGATPPPPPAGDAYAFDPSCGDSDPNDFDDQFMHASPKRGPGGLRGGEPDQKDLERRLKNVRTDQEAIPI